MEIVFGLLILRGQQIAETRITSLTSTYSLRCIGFSDLKMAKSRQQAEKILAFGHPSGSRSLQFRCLGGSTTVLFEATQILN